MPVCHLRNDQICLKITDAKSIIDWMDDQFDNRTIVMTRHPIAQATSVMRAGWFGTGKWLLRSDGYVTRWLDGDLAEYAWQIYRDSPELPQRVLDWVLENLPMLRQLPENPQWHFVSYEDLILHPRQAVEALASFADLSDIDRMLARVSKPSRSTPNISTADRQRAILTQDRSTLLNSWRD